MIHLSINSHSDRRRWPTGALIRGRASRRSRNACSIAPGSARPWPTISNAVPCAGVVNTVFSPAVTVTPFVEAQQLGRDLALVVVHHDHAVELAAQRLEEDHVGRDRPGAVDAFGAQLLHRRTDDADLLRRRTGRSRRCAGSAQRRRYAGSRVRRRAANRRRAARPPRCAPA